MEDQESNPTKEQLVFPETLALKRNTELTHRNLSLKEEELKP